MMKLVICGLLVCANVARAGLEKYSSLVVGDANARSTSPRYAIRVTYLGVNGYQFETSGHVLLIDPLPGRMILLDYFRPWTLR